MRSPDYKPLFAGHETFHMRFGWLKKAYDAVKKTQDSGTNIFSDERAIAEFGVGKNMVAAIRHWAVSCDVIHFKGNQPSITEFGNLLFQDNGLDEFMETANSLWAIHWKLASNSERTTCFWAFNHFNAGSFSKNELAKALMDFAEKHQWGALNPKTLNSDLAVFLHNYIAPKGKAQDDSLACPLTELGLITQGDEERYQFSWTPKTNLHDKIFAWALCQFWREYTNASTINFQTILLEPSSPGRIFLLSENELAVRLMKIEEITEGGLTWSETAGLKQIIRNRDISEDYIASLFISAFKDVSERRAA